MLCLCHELCWYHELCLGHTVSKRDENSPKVWRKWKWSHRVKKLKRTYSAVYPSPSMWNHGMSIAPGLSIACTMSLYHNFLGYEHIISYHLWPSSWPLLAGPVYMKENAQHAFSELNKGIEVSVSSIHLDFFVCSINYLNCLGSQEHCGSSVRQGARQTSLQWDRKTCWNSQTYGRPGLHAFWYEVHFQRDRTGSWRHQNSLR